MLLVAAGTVGRVQDMAGRLPLGYERSRVVTVQTTHLLTFDVSTTLR